MNLKLKPVLAALLPLAASHAMAQSSVNIYGRLNLTLENQKVGTADAVWVESNNSSRIGFKGTEDLGGGLKAGFQIESGFSPDTGAAAGTFWGRQSEISVGGSFGTLRLGNFTSEAYYATADYVSNHNHDTGTSSDALYAYLGRNTNKLAYRLPELAKGLSLEGAASLAESVPGQKRNYELAANYATGGLQLGAGYEKADTTSNSRDQLAVRAFYAMGAVAFGGYVQRDKNAFAAGSRTNVRLSAMLTAGASELHVNVGKAGKTGGVADSGAQQLTLAYNYNLSKRTKVYAFYTRLDDGIAALYGGDFRSTAAGVRHNF